MNAVASSIPASCGRRCWRSISSPGGRGSIIIPRRCIRNGSSLPNAASGQRRRRATTTNRTISTTGIQPQSIRGSALTDATSVLLQRFSMATTIGRNYGSSASLYGRTTRATRKRRRQTSAIPSSMAEIPGGYRTLATLSTNENHHHHPNIPSHHHFKTHNNNIGDETPNDRDNHNSNDNFRPPRWLRKMQRQAASDKPMDSQRAYRYLELEKFDDAEFEDRFRRILRSGEGRLAESTTTTTTTTSTIGEGEVFDETNTNNNNNTTSDDSFDSSKIPEAAVLTQDRLRSYLSETIRREERDHDEATRSLSSSSSFLDAAHTDRLRTAYIEAETRQLWRFLNNDAAATTALTRTEFGAGLKERATALDAQRLAPLATSMVMIGLSVGVTTPAFPFVVQNLGLTTGEYGMVVSAFALTKLLGNIPFAVLVERNGRKPYLVYSLVAISAGVGCVGLAPGFEELYACRLVTGLGVAGLSCAATMAVTDISTPLNRASSFAPISAGFAAGTAMGPALGGMLIDGLGVNPTFYLVGGSFLVLGGINSVLLDETMKKKTHARSGGFPWQRRSRSPILHRSGVANMESTMVKHETTQQQQQQQPRHSNSNNPDDPENTSIRDAFKQALGQWAPLLSEAPVRNVCIVNACYWVALAGGQMTLLPLLLTDPSGLAMTATQVGQVYMGMSFVQVLGNPVFAKAVDRVGTVPGIVGGSSMIAAAMYALPAVSGGGTNALGGYYFPDIPPDHRLQAMAAVLGLWAAGSSLLSTSPIAHVTKHVGDAQRAQAIALLRTAGDVGFLVGASSMGTITALAGSLETAMQSSAAILGTATFWYASRNFINLRLAKSTTKR